jgi:Rab family protein
MELSKTEDNLKIEQKHNNLYKIIIFGDSNVGKTSLISKYLTGKQQLFPMTTLSTEFAIKLKEIDGGGYIKAQIWDTPGQEQYREITFHHNKKFIGGIVVYDITKRISYDNVPAWIKILKFKCEKDCIIVLVGNKLDLVESQPKLREVSRQEAETYAFLNHFIFFETSVYNNNSNCIFDDLLQALYNDKRKIFYKSEIVDENSIEGRNKSNYLNYSRRGGKFCYESNFEDCKKDVGCNCIFF